MSGRSDGSRAAIGPVPRFPMKAKPIGSGARVEVPLSIVEQRANLGLASRRLQGRELDFAHRPEFWAKSIPSGRGRQTAPFLFSLGQTT